MSEVLRKPLDRMDRYFGQIVQQCCRTGEISIRFFTRKPPRLSLQKYVHIRVRVPVTESLDPLRKIRLQLSDLCLMYEYLEYNEKLYNYVDLKFRVV